MRRVLAGAAAAGLGLLLVAPQRASAKVEDWAGSKITTPTTSTSPNPRFEAEIHRKYNTTFQSLKVQIYQTNPAGLPEGCGPTGEREITPVTKTAIDKDVAVFGAASSTPCNGTYRIRVLATLSGLGTDSYLLDGQVDVRVAPPAPSGVDASLNGTSVEVSWAKASDPAPDFRGYRVERSKGDSWEAIKDLDAGTTSFTDASLPPEGGVVRYRVRALREATGSPVLSSPSAEAAVTVPATGGTPGDPTDPGGTDQGTDGGTPGTDGGGGGAGGGGGGSTSTTKPLGSGKANPLGGRSFKPLPKGQLGTGTAAPRIGIPSSSNIPDLLEADNGFSEELDYGNRALAGEGGDDGLSSFYYESGGGKGMAKPVAIGSVFLAWAFHMRFLAKAAKPATATTSRRRRAASQHAARSRAGRSR